LNFRLEIGRRIQRLRGILLSTIETMETRFFLIVGLILSLVSIYWFSTFIEIPIFRMLFSLVVYLVFITGGLIATIFVPISLRFHYWLRRRFTDSIRPEEKGEIILSRIFVSTLLNLAFWMIAYFLPLKTVVSTVPFGKMFETATPSNLYELFAAYPVSFVMFVFFSGSVGPAIVAMIRRSSLTKGRRMGSSLFDFLQIICYVSWFLLVLLFVGVSFDRGKPNEFLQILVSFVLPSTFATHALIRSFERHEAEDRKLWSS